jgi:hypothetical protein
MSLENSKCPNRILGVDSAFRGRRLVGRSSRRIVSDQASFPERGGDKRDISRAKHFGP